MKKGAFTLLELMVVVAIIVVLVAVIAPVTLNAVQAGKQTRSIGNLRNIYVALSIYANETGLLGASLPDHQSAFDLMPEGVLCSPLQTWSYDCNMFSSAPMLGSYGYIRGIAPFQDLSRYQRYLESKGKIHTVAIDIFVASQPPHYFQGDAPSQVNGLNIDQFLMPDRTLRLKSDGSIKLEHERKDANGVRTAFNWSAIFFMYVVDNE